MDKRLKIAIGVVAGLAVIAGLAVAVTAGGDDGDDVATVDSTTTTTEATTSTTAPLGPTLPLLGTPGAIPLRPAFVVKLDNAPDGRPQAGLNAADIVVEEAVEGGITRLFAVFHSTDAESVGPVRSARSTDIGLAGPLNRPLFAYAGANEAFLRLVRSGPLVDVGVDLVPSAYHRERGRPAPYNLFTNTAQLFAAAPAGASPPAPLFRYRHPDDPVEGGEPAGVAHIVFRRIVTTDVRWSWDAASGTFLRTQNGTDHVDAAGARVAATNVVVQLTDYVDTPFVDQSGEPVPEAQLVGEGEAWILTGGQVFRGRWRKASPEARTEYLAADGSELVLSPGRTWIELAPPGAAELT